MADSGSNDDDGDGVDEVDDDNEGVQQADDKDSTKDSACYNAHPHIAKAHDIVVIETGHFLSSLRTSWSR